MQYAAKEFRDVGFCLCGGAHDTEDGAYATYNLTHIVREYFYLTMPVGLAPDRLGCRTLENGYGLIVTNNGDADQTRKHCSFAAEGGVESLDGNARFLCYLLDRGAGVAAFHEQETGCFDDFALGLACASLPARGIVTALGFGLNLVGHTY
jgi:hypothetical protein